MEQDDFDGVAVDDSEVRKLVLSYLLHHCYVDTAKALIDGMGAAGSSDKSRDEQAMAVDKDDSSNTASDNAAYYASISTNYPQMTTIRERKQLFELVNEGKIMEAIKYCEQHFPDVLRGRNGECKDQREIVFQLYSQHFIECIRKGQTKEALQFAQTELWQFGVDDPNLLPAVQDIVALLAYEDAQNSPMSHYLSSEHRECVAHALNNAILSTYYNAGTVALERVLQQLTVVRENAMQHTDKKNKWILREFLAAGGLV
eukprot:Colp12_sorted_trinity150504_noHs@8041